jgi:2-haloacid dehalogenase
MSEPGSQVGTLVFDVMGTVVDVEEPARQAAVAAFASVGADQTRVSAFVEDWNTRLQLRMDDVISGASPWRAHQALRRDALDDALAAAGIDAVAPDRREHLTTVIHRARPWPDSPAALDRLRGTHAVVALSNADFDELVDLSRSGGLGWHGIISTAASHSFKPDPTVYRNAVQMLGVDPSSIMMVAAHPWDLRAAAEHGLATAFVARPGSEPPRPDDRFDLEVTDLHDLAERLGS